ncbi:MAG: anthranilate phosphoribosyltransferase [Syntrophobacterales bacterium]|jgi:anthranilate phosphoribosyltransferase|nr:anthranilate phosphoribosyltransferase [Syntrophobacterales bacterium]
MEERELKEFAATVTAVMAGENLSRDDSREMFRRVLAGEQPDLACGAFLAALRIKGETADEIVGCFESIYEHDTRRVTVSGREIVENCGTGMDSLKTFNISTLAAIVAASLGVSMARHGARAITSRCGTVDLCEALGVDVECSVDVVCQSIETCGIGLFNGMSPEVHPGGLGRILSQLRIGTTFNIAASLANPALPAIGVRGVGAPEQIEPILEVMARIGYRKAILFHGWAADRERGMDELSTLGPSRLGILDGKGGREFIEIEPEDVGISRGSYNEIIPMAEVRDEAVAAVRVLAGRGRQARMDIVGLNAGVILWAAGKADSLGRGVQMAREEIASARPLQKLSAWVGLQNRHPVQGLDRFSELAVAAGIPGNLF